MTGRMTEGGKCYLAGQRGQENSGQSDKVGSPLNVKVLDLCSKCCREVRCIKSCDLAHAALSL